MANYRIMYWDDIPAQVWATDVKGRHAQRLPEVFQEVIASMAAEECLDRGVEPTGKWRWGRMMERPGSAREVLETVVSEILYLFPAGTRELKQFIHEYRTSH